MTGSGPDATASRWTTLAEAPGLLPSVRDLEERDAAPFLVALTERHRGHLDASAPESQFVGLDAEGAPLVVVRAVALRWNGTTSDAPAGGAGDVVEAGETAASADGADTLAVLDVRVRADRRGQGIGRRVLGELPGLAAAAGLDRLLLLVRPHAKQHHPLVPFARYVAATDASGRPLDGWLAAAWDAGLHPVLAVDRSLRARAPLADFARWYGRAFPTSGPYLLPGAIKPAVVELERAEGRYREPHLWMAPAADLAQRAVEASALRVPEDAWRRALAATGLVVHGRRHRRPD
ncbi:MAG TPA: hypothetical protein VK906_12625 [Egicoccus sp.]|nr:hypothetical protein [Egicoccus sp.]HSK24020.1 hypothetical protein [Egicoccus sp.]